MHLASIRQDLQSAARALRRHTGFAIVVVLSLALAIALNTTMYSVLDALVHPRVDLRDPSSLARIQFFGDYHRPPRVSAAQRDSLLLAGVPAITAITWSATGGGSYTSMSAGDRYAEGSVDVVPLSYFGLMGPRIVAGRTFIPADTLAATPPLVINEQLAHRLFPRSANPIGATVRVDNRAFIVVGVLSRYAAFRDNSTPAFELGTQPPQGRYVRTIRIRPGTPGAELQREIDRAAARIAVIAGDNPKDDAFRIALPGAAEFALKRFHYALILAVVAVLLVACANVANMQLARGIGRGRELAVRAALGAGRTRIIVHLLAETVVLAGIGLALGLVLTYVGSETLRATIPPSVGEYVVEPRLSWRVLVFAVGATVACIAMVGLVPAIKISRVDPNELLKSGAGTGATRLHRRQYGYLVVVELALALGLMSATIVMIRGAIWSNAVWTGYDTSHLALGYALFHDVPAHAVATGPYLDSIAARVRTLPGVADASVERNADFDHDTLTISDASGVRLIAVAGYGPRMASPSVFRTIGRPIIMGHDFAEGTRDHAAAIIDEYTAKKLWPNANPVGALIKLGGSQSHRAFIPIVGVVGQTDRFGKPAPINIAEVSEKRGFAPTIGQIWYLPGPGDSIPAGKRPYPFNSTVTVRATGNPAAVVPTLIANGVNYSLTMDDATGLTRMRQSRDFLASLFAIFGVLGLGLAAFGVYGVVAHSVAERRRELGVRIALGATNRDVLRAVLRESVIIALVGTAVGLLLTKWGVPMVALFSAEDDIYNAPLFAAVAAALGMVAALSAFVPAWRATRLDPTECLRSE